MFQKNLDQRAKWLLISGVMLIFFIPLLLPILDKLGFGQYGVVGDAIGGITNPFSNIVGAVLLYLALKAQLSSNGIVQKQIDKENAKDDEQFKIERIQSFLVFFRKNIENFDYEINDGNSKQLLHGRRAIKRFLGDLEKNKIDIHNEEELLMFDGVRELLSILRSAEILYDELTQIELSEQYTILYHSLLRHELVFNVFPYQDLDDEINLKTKQCPICGEAHAYFPPLLYDKIKNLETKFI